VSAEAAASEQLPQPPPEPQSQPLPQQPALVSQGTPSPDDWVRLSLRALAVRPVTDLLRSAPVLIGLLYEGTRGGQHIFWGLGFGAFAVLAGVWRWLGTRYQVTPDRVYVRRGLLSPKVLSTPRAGVRSVDLTAHVIYRMLGVAQVKIGTGRNDKREGEGFKLDALSVADALALRTLLLTATVPDTAHATPLEETEIVRLRASWIRFAPLTMTGLVVLGVLAGFVSQTWHDVGVDLASLGPVQSSTRDLTRMPLAEAVPVGAVAILAALVFVSVLGYVAVFWNFRLVRTGTGSLRVTRGLFSTRATTIDETRLRGVEISEPLSLRAAKGARCLAITTGLRVGGGAERGGSVLLPPAPRAVAHEVASQILGVPVEFGSAELIRHGPGARRRRELRAVVPVLLVYIAVMTPLTLAGIRLSYWVPASLPVVLWLSWLLGRDRYRGLGHRLIDDWLIISTGSLVRRRSILSVHGIVGWRLRQSWFQRRRGLVSVMATTAAGKQRYAAVDMPMAEALAFITAATPDLVTPFVHSLGAGPGPKLAQ